jgi:hypothetical protein
VLLSISIFDYNSHQPPSDQWMFRAAAEVLCRAVGAGISRKHEELKADGCSADG